MLISAIPSHTKTSIECLEATDESKNSVIKLNTLSYLWPLATRCEYSLFGEHF